MTTEVNLETFIPPAVEQVEPPTNVKRIKKNINEEKCSTIDFSKGMYPVVLIIEKIIKTLFIRKFSKYFRSEKIDNKKYEKIHNKINIITLLSFK